MHFKSLSFRDSTRQLLLNKNIRERSQRFSIYNFLYLISTVLYIMGNISHLNDGHLKGFLRMKVEKRSQSYYSHCVAILLA